MLHRGTEKLAETKMYLNSLPYFDRLDYVSTLLQEHSYALNIETILKKKIKNKFLIKTRTVFDELTRILNHYLAISCHALDVGSMSPIFWAFEDREKIMEFYEYFTGARMHTALYKPLYQYRFLNRKLSKNILNYVHEGLITLNEIHNVLSNNKIWKIRLKNNGIINLNFVEKFGITGPLARSTGLKKDLRINTFYTYGNYHYFNFSSYITKNGDSYDRFLLRMYEIKESLLIVKKNIFFKKFKNNFKNKNFTLMEEVIKHFKYWSYGFNLKTSLNYLAVESSKGEFGTLIISDNTNKPYRCKIRSPSFHHLFALTNLSINNFIADLVTLIGTIDIVFGEIDR